VGEKKQGEEDLVVKRKKHLQKCAVLLFKQIKNGCNKDICFNTYCQKNPYCKEELSRFKDDKQILGHLYKMLLET